jgi:DNA-binding NarL/FixJ family response regulator
MPIPIALVEDNDTLRRRFIERLGFFRDVELTVTAGSGEDFLEDLKRLPEERHPKVVLMDIELPMMSGIDTTALARERYPALEVMMLTVFEDEEKIFQSIQAGAAGYLLKDTDTGTIVGAILDVLQGGAPMSPPVARKLLRYVREEQSRGVVATANQPGTTFDLTPREFDILEGIVRDDTEEVLADTLHISPQTVRTHIKNIYKKLHVHSRAAAVRVAFENQLLR